MAKAASNIFEERTDEEDEEDDLLAFLGIGADTVVVSRDNNNAKEQNFVDMVKDEGMVLKKSKRAMLHQDSFLPPPGLNKGEWGLTIKKAAPPQLKKKERRFSRIGDPDDLKLEILISSLQETLQSWYDRPDQSPVMSMRVVSTAEVDASSSPSMTRKKSSDLKSASGGSIRTSSGSISSVPSSPVASRHAPSSPNMTAGRKSPGSPLHSRFSFFCFSFFFFFFVFFFFFFFCETTT
jgi:hypothetical protein